MGLTTKEIGSSSFNDMISSVDRRSEYVENRAGANVTLNNFLTPYTLDNKSSILNAPCGYSNGMYASLRPVQTIGPELVTNGNFDTDSDWTKDSGWSISGGLATRTNTGSYGALYQNCLTNGKKYKVTITISSITSQGFFGVRLGTNYILQGITEAGTYTATGTSTSTTLSVMGNPTFAGSIDSISIKEVTDADFDFTRGSSATRVNEKGLIEDVQILSGELVQNGDFEQIGSELVTNGNFDTDSDWTKSAQSSISDGKARILSTDGSYQFIAQTNSGFTNTQGKFVKITLDIVEYVSGTLKAQFSGGTNYNLPQSVGTHTLYVKNDGSTGTLNLARVAGQTDITIDNVSVKEVGQNWTFVGEAEFTANGARIYSSSGDQSYINQPILTNTKKYKISYEIIDSTQGSLKLINVNGLSDYPIPSTVGTHTLDFTANNPTLFIYRNSGATDVTIDNISVIEITDNTDIPRIDYTSGFGSLLLEPQSTNKVTYSEDFSDGMRTGWTLLGSVQANSSSSPDGLTNATKFTRTDTQYNLLRVSASTLHVTSVFVKNIDANNFYIRKSAASYAYYNFDTKTVNDNSLKVEYFSNDWIRLSLSTDETSYRQFGIGQSETDLSEVGNSVYVWGAQLEQGSYATSYIPTNGSTVTRSADVANNSGNANLINSTEGVLYAEIAALANSGNKRRISLSDGTQSNGVILALDAQDDRVKILIKSGGSTQANSQSAVVITATDFNKIAIKYKENDFALWVNGTEVFVDSSGLAPIGLNKLAFDFDSKSNFYGNVKALAVFKEALTDAELAQITLATQQEVFYEMRDRMLQINADYYELMIIQQDLKIILMANLYNKAGLVNIPIGYSNGFLYNIKPTDNTLAFRFNRDSSATRVNKQGLIEQVSYFGPELVTNGNFATDSDWALRFVVIEDGVAKFQESVGTYARVRQNTGFTGQAKVTYTISFNNTSITTIQLRDYGGADATNVPATVGTHTLYRNFTTSAINFQSGDLAAGEEIHLDNVSVVEVLGDKPRIDYTDSLTSPSFLLEPQRTNLITYSEDFNSADWNRSDLTITSDDAISPYGTSTADKIAFTGNGSLRASNTFTFTDAYTYSIFVKKGNTRYVTLRSFAFTTSAIVGFDLDSVTAQAGGVIEQYPNDWFRLSISKDVSSDADKNGYFYFYLPNSLGSTTSVNGNYAYIFGNQIEEGSYATSYIPTSGSTATRVAETCNGAGNASTFNDSEGVLYAEIAALADDSTNRLLSINDSTSSNSIWLYFNTANNVTYSVRVGGIAQASATHTIDIKTFNKIAIKYKENDFAVWFNGVKTLTDTSGNTYTSGTLNNISFDAGDGGLDFYGKVKSVYVFNEALTDDELQQLTS